MFVASLTLELSRNAVMLRKLSGAQSRRCWRSASKRTPENIFATAENAVKGSLERGEMDKFITLLQDQKRIKGLLEFSLFNRQGVVTHSSDAAFLNKHVAGGLRSSCLHGLQAVHAHHQRLL